jgi:NAD(P)-dependent dehydrogenase (short-subunit alcohol dehydrogenase family)
MSSFSASQEALRALVLKGKTALVAGATGEVGRGAAHALSDAGAFVYLAGRSTDKLLAIQRGLPHPDRSSVIGADYSSLDGAKAFRQALEGRLSDDGRRLDVVVASSGPWWPVRYLAGPGADLDTIYNATQANLNSHLFLYNILAPQLEPGTGQYLLINGAAARNIPGMGLTAVTANAVVGAAQLMNAQPAQDGGCPHFTHVLLASSVGHETHRGPTTNDPNEYGRAFVAMALNRHSSDKDGHGTLILDDAMAAKLIAGLSQE